MRRLALALVACSACVGRPPASADLGPDTDDSDAPADTDVAVDVESTYNYAIVHLRILPSDQGLDLNGDGVGDNELGSSAQPLNATMADALLHGGRAITLQVAGASNLTDDQVSVGLFTGTSVSPDGGPSGEPLIDPGIAVGADGRALLASRATLSSGTYRVVLANRALSIGSLTFQVDGGLHVVSQVTEDAQAGTLGLAANATALAALLRAADQGSIADAIEAHADVDTNADGTRDAISVALEFSAVRVALTAAP
jgi:hypothetical protein